MVGGSEVTGLGLAMVGGSVGVAFRLSRRQAASAAPQMTGAPLQVVGNRKDGKSWTPGGRSTPNSFDGLTKGLTVGLVFDGGQGGGNKVLM